MKLAKALKLKNRLAGEIAQIQRLINESNVTEAGNAPAHDVNALLATLLGKQANLAELKGSIAAGNVPIAQDIAMMAELKSRIAFLRALPTKNGSFITEGRYGTTPVERVYRATIQAKAVEDMIEKYTTEIDAIQDRVDQFNAVTNI